MSSKSLRLGAHAAPQSSSTLAYYVVYISSGCNFCGWERSLRLGRGAGQVSQVYVSVLNGHATQHGRKTVHFPGSDWSRNNATYAASLGCFSSSILVNLPCLQMVDTRTVCRLLVPNHPPVRRSRTLLLRVTAFMHADLLVVDNYLPCRQRPQRHAGSS